MNMHEVYENIEKLVAYGLETGLIEKEDVIYTRNRLLEALKLQETEFQEEQWEGVGPETGEKADKSSGERKAEPSEDLESILKGLLDYACEEKLIADTITERDLFDTKLMGLLVPRPSEVIKSFYSLYESSPREATDYYYRLSQDSDYIRRYRIKKDKKWKVSTEYGDLDITINLSKPEKDPKAIAAAKLAKQSGYPKCLLCKENEGYAGRINHPARQNHRIIPVTINGQQWGFQYSPYVYYKEHCIVFNSEHTPMRIDKAAFRKLFDFVIQFPHYMVGSNADLPIVGGSILSHDHFQGGNYEFPMAKAEIEEHFQIKDFEDVEVGRVKWPMSVLRLRGRDEARLIELGDRILTKWRAYSDPEAEIYAFTGEEPHNTITPIARKKGDIFELDLVLRNNRTTKEHPLGLFHPHAELHHIKKENIGLIEVMGLAVLPARLKDEMKLLEEYMIEGKDISTCKAIEKHNNWVREIRKNHSFITEENVEEVLKQEVGEVFLKVLEHAGVYKRTEKGRFAFQKFVEIL